jgi:uncharacterized membrane protein
VVATATAANAAVAAAGWFMHIKTTLTHLASDTGTQPRGWILIIIIIVIVIVISIIIIIISIIIIIIFFLIFYLFMFFFFMKQTAACGVCQVPHAHVQENKSRHTPQIARGLGWWFLVVAIRIRIGMWHVLHVACEVTCMRIPQEEMKKEADAGEAAS